MGRYAIQRLLGVIPLLFIVSILVFMFIHLIPGDPARLVAGKDATLEEINGIREQLGLNLPLWQQYVNYMGDLLKGDLGESVRSGIPVMEMLESRFLPTIILTFTSLGWALIIGLLIGIVTAVNRGKWPDYIGMLAAISGISLPGFWLGLVLIQVFSVQLGWFPTGGIDTWQSYILPSFTLGAGIMSMLARYSRSSMLETMREDYVRTGRAKGLREFTVVGRHALRNSLIQVVTVAGLQFGFLLGGSVMVETVFSIPGMGRLLVDSIAFRDYTVIQALLLMFAAEFILINLIVDLLYGVLNPKIRYASK
ncbi:binding-protein-dependent transport systems inner membrane component [Paenibacillus vortex V453]|uniref:Glutathione transport system permease protein GsiC n=2 Tax=Paenibacillus TaxID=44249 RepID=A0A163DZ65_9BACL|nr:MULTISPECIES: ABC transporter permease subunit [Paenibacillus]ANA82912.1 glutathione ABC transporter permease GsiC [Paenibacillus glucanolyticus]AVV58001.1 glutathione ABC transporter permease GsiC [Paenibacillus glucanolyticus]AWP27161.1 glutathione ABC transporter permease GsiC [Paenibacillus sp. Cedars]EFU39835.1 binding-protein-dependent transport systems inner membrane component [Paenibacillus vortex V453]ETT34803.1 binding-protein-dependent transport systems inner membrane component [